MDEYWLILGIAVGMIATLLNPRWQQELIAEIKRLFRVRR